MFISLWVWLLSLVCVYLFAAVEEIRPENLNLLRLLIFQQEHLFKDLKTLRETSIVNLKARQHYKTIINAYTRQNDTLLDEHIQSYL